MQNYNVTEADDADQSCSRSLTLLLQKKLNSNAPEV